jgi:hypothetical protein
MQRIPLRTIVLGVLVAVAALYAFSLRTDTAAQDAASSLSDIRQKVAADAVAQYNIARRQGDPIQICVQAGLVAAAYLQAQDESNYQQWKRSEKNDCKSAGFPR